MSMHAARPLDVVFEQVVATGVEPVPGGQRCKVWPGKTFCPRLSSQVAPSFAFYTPVRYVLGNAPVASSALSRAVRALLRRNVLRPRWRREDLQRHCTLFG